MKESKDDELFELDSVWLDSLCREYVQTVSNATGEDMRAVSARMGKAMVLLGTTYIGVPLQLDPKESITIAKHALRKLQDAYRRRKNSASN